MARLHDDGTVVVLRRHGGGGVRALPGWPGRIAVEAARDLHALLRRGLAQGGR
jgi:hypothetical protein